MAHRGVHFALTKSQESRVLNAAGDDEAVLAVVGEIEEAWDASYLYETDAAWNAIHRCFCNGKLLYTGGTYPLNHAICGGRQLMTSDDADYTVSYVAPAQVREVAEALTKVTKD